MNAINPAPSTASAGSDGRPYEPSMEEILASIRRIIADDQSLPARSSLRDLPAFRSDPPHAADPHVAVSYAADSEAAVSRIADPQPAPAPPAAAAPEPKTVTAMSPHGHVAAPQFPTPDMPPLAPSILHTLVAVEAAPGESSAAPVLARAPHSSVEPEHLVEPERSVRTYDAASPAADVAVRHHAEPFYADAAAPHVQAAEPVHPEPAPAEAAEPDEEPDPYFDPPIERDEPRPAAETPAGLFSVHTKQSVSTAFNVLAATRLADNSEELLGLARDMIRPLLKTWLDDNLPSMVERLVRAEIERVARGGR